MSDDPLSSPARVPATAEWLAEQRRKQDAYENARRRHYDRFRRQSWGEGDDEAEAVSVGSPAGPARRRSRGKINDPRQLKFEV